MPSIILTHTTRYKNRHADGGGYYSLEIQITLDVNYRIKFSHRVPAIRSYPIIPIERYICDIPYIPQHMLDAIRLMHGNSHRRVVFRRAGATRGWNRTLSEHIGAFTMPPRQAADDDMRIGSACSARHMSCVQKLPEGAPGYVSPFANAACRNASMAPLGARPSAMP